MKSGPTSFFHWWKLHQYIATLRRLKFEQIFYRIFYPVKRKLYNFFYAQERFPAATFKYYPISFPHFSTDKGLYDASNNTFYLLNKPKSFGRSIDWDFQEYGALWQFHLHYFDWLNDPQLSNSEALGVVNQFIENQNNNKIFYHSYPLSIRVINWIKFLLRTEISDERIIAELRQQLSRLAHFPEYEIGANHLLTNAIALVWGGVCFDDQKLSLVGVKLLNRELSAQFLPDGMHYEKSFAYQSVLLRQLLELYGLLLHHNKYNFLIEKLKIILIEALYKLKLVENSDGFYPNFGDSNQEMSFPFHELQSLAQSLGINYLDTKNLEFGESGYRFWALDFRFKLLLNTGNIAAVHQPGHAHADALSFCLNIDDQYFIVDRAVSTYQEGAVRNEERGTGAHNTIQFGQLNSAAIWKAFRMGKSPSIKSLDEFSYKIEFEFLSRNKIFKLWHLRSFQFAHNVISICDQFPIVNEAPVRSYLHFHPRVCLQIIDERTVFIASEKIKIYFEYCLILEEDYLFCEGFNKTMPAKRLVMLPRADKIIMNITSY